MNHCPIKHMLRSRLSLSLTTKEFSFWCSIRWFIHHFSIFFKGVHEGFAVANSSYQASAEGLSVPHFQWVDNPVRLDFALMILEAQTVFHLLYSIDYYFAVVFQDTQGLSLCVRAGFGALHWQQSTNFDRSTKLHLSTEPAFLPNACYSQLSYLYYFAIT